MIDSECYVSKITQGNLQHMPRRERVTAVVPLGNGPSFYHISLYPEALKQKQKIEGIFPYTQCIEALRTFQALELLNLMINGYRVESQLQQGGGGTPATHRFIEFNRQSTQIIGFLVGKSKVSLLIHDDQW